MGVYAKAAKRRERLSGSYLEAFDAALEWARMGTNADESAVAVAEHADERTPEKA
jgi:hypothetical protein